MFIGGTWNFSVSRATTRICSGASRRIPYFAKGKPATPSGSWHLAVNPRTSNREGDVRFMRSMTSEEAQIMWFKLRPHPPVLLSVWDKLPDAFNTDGWRIVRYELEHTAVPSPASPGYREFDRLLGVTLKEMQSAATSRCC